MTLETAAWVQSGAAVVQALAALAVLWLTVQLIKATREYVATTRDQVGAAQSQLEELKESRRGSEAQLQELRHARKASIRPTPRVVSAALREGTPLALTLFVSNYGEGPALDLTLLRDYPGALTMTPEKLNIRVNESAILTLVADGALDFQHSLRFSYWDAEDSHFRLYVEIDLNQPSPTMAVVTQAASEIPVPS